MTISDRYERKAQIAIAALCIAVFGLAFSQQTGAAGILVFGILVTLSNNWMSFSFHAYQAELYPTQIRAQAVGFVYSWSRFSTIFTAFIIAFFLGRFGTTGVFVDRGLHGRCGGYHRRLWAARHPVATGGAQSVRLSLLKF